VPSKRAWALNEIAWALPLLEQVSGKNVYLLAWAILKECWTNCKNPRKLKRVIRCEDLPICIYHLTYGAHGIRNSSCVWANVQSTNKPYLKS
jgi:hypothetical protein